jgi:hypothetical protein
LVEVMVRAVVVLERLVVKNHTLKASMEESKESFMGLSSAFRYLHNMFPNFICFLPLQHFEFIV